MFEKNFILVSKCLPRNWELPFQQELGIAFSTVNRWENCKGKPQYAAVKKFYDYCTKHGIEFDD